MGARNANDRRRKNKARRVLAAMTSLLALCMLVEPARGQDTIAAGREFALLACSACHVIDHGQQSRPLLIQKTPSFEEIANKPGTTAASLRLFLATTSWDGKTLPITMPNLMLTTEQAKRVINYLLSLRKRHQKTSGFTTSR